MRMDFRWLAGALILCLGACAQAPMRPDVDAPVASSRAAEAERKPDAAKREAEPEAERKETAVADKGEDVVRGTGELINMAAATRPVRKPPVQGEASFNFADTPITEVVKVVLGDLLQESYVIAPGVSGTVTFSTARPVTTEQALAILEMLLSWNNLALVYTNGQYSVVPAGNAVQGNLVPRVAAAEAARGYEVRAIPLRFIAATEMEKLLQPFARQGAILKADNSRSLIIVAGTRRELENYMSSIEIFDVDWIKGMSIGMFTLERVEVKSLVPELEQIFGEQSQSPLAGMFRFVPIERLNAVLVITPQQRYLDEAERWISRLDRGGNEPGVRLYVYDVKNVKATDLADRLNDIFGGSGGGGGQQRRSSSAAGAVAPGLQPVELTSSRGSSINTKSATGDTADGSVPNMGGAAPAAGGAPAAGVPGAVPMATAGGGEQGLAIVDGEDIRITAVEENNQLIIRATPGQYEAIRGAIRRLDAVPLQVHIEAKLLDVGLSNNLNYGVQWYFENALDALPDTGDDDDTEQTARLLEIKSAIRGDQEGRVSGSGVQWVFAGRRAGALVNILQDEGDVKVLSSPSVMVLNNTEASINIGQQIPVTSSFFNPIGGGSQVPGGQATQSFVQFRDTGITLSVKPRVNPGGLVFMEIQAEQSTPGPASAATQFGGNLPVDKKTIETEVAVQSGDTVLLGGLIQQNDTDSNAGVPGLKNIPVIGSLFGNRKRESSRQELLVLITPTVIEGGSEAANELTEEYKRRFLGLEPLIRETEAAERARAEARLREAELKEQQ